MNTVEPQGTKEKSRYQLTKEFKISLIDNYDNNELIAMYEDTDYNEFVESLISVYYVELVEQCNELTGQEWSQVWLNPSDFGKENPSPYDILADNLYMLYSEIAAEALEELVIK